VLLKLALVVWDTVLAEDPAMRRQYQVRAAGGAEMGRRGRAVTPRQRPELRERRTLPC
jgi:hypothetical protein